MAGRVWIGDLAIAWRSVALDDRRRAMIADLLGLASAAAAGATADPPASTTFDSAAPARPLISLPASPPVIQPPLLPLAKSSPSLPTSKPRRRGAAVNPSLPLLNREPSRGARDPSPETAINDLPVLQPQSLEPPPPMIWTVESLPQMRIAPVPLPSHEPLFPRRAAPAIVTALLSRNNADGPLDVAAAVTRLAALEVLTSLPRERRRTLRFGAQVLVDRSDTMRVFARDQAELIRLIRGILGDRAEVRNFSRSTLHGVADLGVSRHQPYRFPANGAAILLVSDFGAVSHPNAAAGASRWEWERFFALARHHRHDLVGLIPYPKNRWPTWLDRQLPLIQWDRGTTAGDVIAKLR